MPYLGGLALRERPVVSVCIANFNGSAIIAGCIESVLSQDCDFPVEIIVHDDASTDGSVDLIKAHYPDVQLIVSTENVGFCVANNRMAAFAQGRYLLLLNNDAMLLPDALLALYAETERLDRPAILTLPQYDADTGALLDMGCRLDIFLNPVPNRDPMQNDVGTVHGACLWVDKRLWEEIGGFPKFFGSVGEDLYLCCSARLAGHPVRSLGVSGYRHHVGKSFGGGKVRAGRLASTFRRRALSERNKTFVMVVVYPAPFVQVMLPVHLLLLVIEGSLLSFLKWDSVYLRQIYWPAIAGLINNRSVLGSLRKISQERRFHSVDFFAVFDWMPYKLRMLLKFGLPTIY